ncbi:MAG: ATP-binding protein [Dehalococcoidia bacterium]
MTDLYIGKSFDQGSKALGDPFLVDPSDFTTHGIVIGMTGSGKTGLSVCIIEELLKANVPVIVIDPKGDMANLALAFDRLQPSQFEPWIDRDDAVREGKALADIASSTAALWQKGLADWNISPSDVASYASGRRMKIFTPGTSAGIGLNLIDSLDWPGIDFEANEEELRDEIDAIITGILGFIQVDADPIASREYILLFNLVEAAWRKDQSLTLESLIGQVANPPLEKIGALPVDAFFPQKDRNALMFALNNLVASPRFEPWREGEPIDIESWVRSPDGVPQLSVVYTAHLDDEERIFVTALILNKLKTWMRKQPGTGELRCLFYMDEIFGYFPPTANPPTKKPLLTLLKQARAYGVGVLLSTQNPVDLDYKGLSNMGFWAIGRLQTTQDQERVRQGIESALADASSQFDFKELIGGVQKRVFLVHDIHRKAPALVHSRWAMSYLRGPITRDEIRQLGPLAITSSASVAVPAASAAATQVQSAAPLPAAAPAPVTVAPPLPAPLSHRFVRRYGGDVAQPYLFVKASVRYRTGTIATPEEVREMAFRLDPSVPAGQLLEQEAADMDESALASEVPTGLRFAELPSFVQSGGARGLERVLADRLDDRLAATFLYDPSTRQWAALDEDESTFARRLSTTEKVDARRRTFEERLAKKRADLGIKQQELSGRRLEKWASVGSAILSNIGLFTKKTKTVRTGGLNSVLTKNRMEGTASQRKEKLELEIAELEGQVAALGAIDPARFELRVIKPSKTDVSLIRYDVVWVY